ncbi:prenyltransferase/squalene oxidase repeat-containing protein [Streptomyces axinellae]
MSPRRRHCATALAAATVLCATAAPVASAQPSTATASAATSATSVTSTKADKAGKAGKLPNGLYGEADPKYDGVWRQSMALLALDGAGAVPAKKAVDWLTGQQCEDGSFTAYRPDAGDPCDAKKTPSDINATTLAVQALAAVGGRGAEVGKAVDWLKSAQGKDGGWGYAPGSPSDANSTSLAIGALHAAGENPKRVTTGGGTPFDALLSFQLTCGTKGIEDAPGAQGAFAYQPDKKDRLAPNDDATAAASLAGLGEGILVEPLDKNHKSAPVTPLKCATADEDSDEKGTAKGADSKTDTKGDDSEKGDGKGSATGDPGQAAGAGAAYLASTLKKNGGHLTAPLPGSKKQQPDYANTADAVIALAAGGHRTEAGASLKWLSENLGKWDKAENDPAAISSLMLASRATGGDPTKLGSTNLLTRLNKTGPAPAQMPASHQSDSSDDASKDDGTTIPVWAFIIVGLAVGAGFGILLSGRRKRQQL